MRLTLACALALAAAGVAQAERVPHQPGYTTLAAAAESGEWRWADGQSVRANGVGLRCVEAQGAFRIDRLVVWADSRAECNYTDGDQSVIRVEAGPRSDPPEEKAENSRLSGLSSLAPFSISRVARARDLGDCDGVLVRFTASPSSGTFPNGTPRDFRGYEEVSYFLRSGRRSLEVTSIDQFPPLVADEAVVTALAAASGVC